MLYTFRVNRRLAFTVENPLAIFAGDWSLPVDAQSAKAQAVKSK